MHTKHYSGSAKMQSHVQHFVMSTLDVASLLIEAVNQWLHYRAYGIHIGCSVQSYKHSVSKSQTFPPERCRSKKLRLTQQLDIMNQHDRSWESIWLTSCSLEAGSEQLAQLSYQYSTGCDLCEHLTLSAQVTQNKCSLDWSWKLYLVHSVTNYDYPWTLMYSWTLLAHWGLFSLDPGCTSRLHRVYVL